MNFGLRWDYRAATYEARTTSSGSTPRTPKAACAMPTRSSPPTAWLRASASTAARFCAIAALCRVPGPKNPFAPRFGINYRLNDKTVVRGGYGIFYNSYEGREIDDSADIYPYSIRNSLNPTTVPIPAIRSQTEQRTVPDLLHAGAVPRVDAVVHRGYRVGESARSLRSVLDALGGARVGKEHHP